MSFEQLQQKCILPSKFFFKHLQIRHYIQTQQGGCLSKVLSVLFHLSMASCCS